MFECIKDLKLASLIIGSYLLSKIKLSFIQYISHGRPDSPVLMDRRLKTILARSLFLHVALTFFIVTKR